MQPSIKLAEQIRAIHGADVLRHACGIAQHITDKLTSAPRSEFHYLNACEAPLHCHSALRIETRASLATFLAILDYITYNTDGIDNIDLSADGTVNIRFDTHYYINVTSLTNKHATILIY